MKLIILLLMPLMSLAQPDTSKAYITGNNPIKAIRFYRDGTFVAHSYQKPYKQKDVRTPIEKTDSGTYSVSRFGIILKGKFPKLMRYDDKKKDLYAGIFKPKRIKKTDASLFPTVKEWERLEWIRKNRELYIKESQEYIKKKAIACIKRYCPEYMILVDSSYCGPGCYNAIIKGKTIQYSGDTAVHFPRELNTIVHESAHHYNKEEWDGKQIRHRYMITPGRDIWATHTKLYESSEFIAIVPKDAPSRIYRYGTYVGHGSSVSANEWGIYGMMDEFSAYYNGTLADWKGYLHAKSQADKAAMQTFENGCFSTYHAWLEFRIFIGWYLKYAMQKYPDIYKGTMENRELAKAFAELDREFGDLVQKIDKEFESSYTREYYKDDVSYLEKISKGLDPLLDEFKNFTPAPAKKKKKHDKLMPERR